MQMVIANGVGLRHPLSQRNVAGIRLQLWRPMAAVLPVLAASARLAIGAGIGAAFGATTSYLWFWIASGIVMAGVMDALSANSTADAAPGEQPVAGLHRMAECRHDRC